MARLDGTIDNGLTLRDRLRQIANVRGNGPFPLLVQEMIRRNATNPVDKVAGLIAVAGVGAVPVYKPKETDEEAWTRWMRTIHRLDMDIFTFLHGLLILFPHPSARYWFPSWKQVCCFPDVSLRESTTYKPERPVRVVSKSSYVGVAIYLRRLHRGCILKRLGNTYEASCGPFMVNIHSTTQDGVLPEFEIDESLNYTVFYRDIAHNRDIAHFRNMRIFAVVAAIHVRVL
ncbi:hypothetical protein BDZ91DRAFT_797759 [Kalaharituber pfeilii]|nr:hypothetical protein BDZ91DRAFT_797759 [Kalaharituber pfeilii]